MEDNTICCGDIHPFVLDIIGQEDNAYIGNINMKIPHLNNLHVAGQIIMIEPITYDIPVFSLLREMFGLSFPMVIIAKYKSCDFIITKRFIPRDLKEDDYYPPTVANRDFRFHLALLVFVCKIIGCALKLNDIKVYNGKPYFWKCKSLGYRKASFINEDAFLKLFGISLEDAKKNKLSQFAREVLEYFNEVDFDTDVLRKCLYMKDDIVRYSKGLRVKYPLSRKPRCIEDVMEENYSTLIGEYPFSIFK